MTPLLVSAYTLTTCLGRGLSATLAGLRAGSSGLAPCAFETAVIDTWIGEVAAVDARHRARCLGWAEVAAVAERRHQIPLGGMIQFGFKA